MPNVIAKFSGDNQTQGIATLLAQPMVARVTDLGNPVSGVTVSFAIQSSPSGAAGQSLSVASAVTGADGKAQVFLTLGDKTGTYVVRFTSAGVTGSPLDFNATCGAVVSLADVKSYLKITSATNDTLLAMWIGVVSQKIEAWFEQPVALREVEDILNGNGSGLQYLRTGRIGSLIASGSPTSILNSIQRRNDALSTWENIIDNIALVFVKRNSWRVELLDGYIFTYGQKNIRIFYNCGFDPIPGDITVMGWEMMAMMWKEANVSGIGQLGEVSSNSNSTGTSFSASLLDLEKERWKRVIDRYRRLS